MVEPIEQFPSDPDVLNNPDGPRDPNDPNVSNAAFKIKSKSIALSVFGTTLHVEPEKAQDSASPDLATSTAVKPSKNLT